MKEKKRMVGKLMMLFIVLSNGIINNAFADSSYKLYNNDNLPQKEDIESVRYSMLNRNNQGKVKVYGRILEAKDPPAPLHGVSIRVKGTTNGTLTDEKGVFELTVQKNSTLVIGMVGFKTKEYIVHAEQNNLIISLERELVDLDQVVITGFAKQKVREIASSVSSINMENVVNKPVVQLSQALQGGSTGIQVSQTTGLVGGDQANIRIRGIGTIGNANPLVLVDGVPFDMNNLDPNSVSSITVLKDAAAASMYGARGANGVILVTTKRGVAGVPNIEYNGYYGIQQPQFRPDFVDAPTWMRMRNEASINAGGNAVYSDAVIDTTAKGLDLLRYPNTDWTDLILRKNIPIQQHSILVSGGNTAARFALSINHTDQLGQLNKLGALDQSRYKRTTVRANTTVDLLKNLFVYMDLFASRGDQSESYASNRLTTDIYRRLYTVPPNVVAKYPDKDPATSGMRPGYTYYGAFGESWNPVAMLERGGNLTRTRDEILINMRPQWQIIQNLNLNTQVSYRVTSGLDKSNQESYIFYNYFTNRREGSDYATVKSASPTARETYFYWGGNLDYKIAYQKHNVNGILGFTQEIRNYESWKDVALRSVFAKLYYNYDNRYLLEAGIRRDGSSLFAEKNRWGFFPSVAVGWNIDKESFFDPEVITALKLRASYGVLGNNSINPYQYQTVINTNGTEQIIGNPDLRWEKSNVLNLATDINLKSGFDLTFEWFEKKTRDVLITPEQRFTGGLGTTNTLSPVNSASVRIRGIEANIRYNKNIVKDFMLTAGLGYTRNNSKILNLLGGNLPVISGNTIMYIDGNMREYYGYPTHGLLQQEDMNDPTVVKIAGQAPGDIHFIDTNGDGTITNQDRIPMGSTQPKDIFFGSLGFKYKGFDFDALLSGEAGSPAFYTDALAIPFNNTESGTPQKFQMDYWTPANTDARYPRLLPARGANGNFSDYFMLNGKFLRVRYIQLGYTLPAHLIQSIRGKMLRVYINAQNPFTFSAVKYMDPEVRGNQTTVPLMKAFTMGLSLKF
ncbi:SusC/RagA family TonB-linked outer membrane protein [Sphingobacterium spiritivorum]|uniref:SusC/RagA family TonB-linked outer membrane protein n=1 Tax=Sphingobacterium spiritivorum TaxID=258 RepID=UPI003DA20978